MESFENWLRSECSPEQLAPVLVQDQNVVVTAGAGSGKTRTLISRYLSLLQRYRDPRRVVAITFTEKAAEEMRSRVRSSLLDLIANAAEVQEKAELRDLSDQLDAARISTIHSLCMEILMDNPVAAVIDPASRVLDEVETGLLRQEVIRTVLDQIAEDPRFEIVFLQIESTKLRGMLSFMLDNRLKIQESADGEIPFPKAMEDFFQTLFSDSSINAYLDEFAAFEDRELESLGRLEQAHKILKGWEAARKAAQNGEFADSARLLFNVRYNQMRNFSQRNHPAVICFKGLRQIFDDLYAPGLGFRSDDPDLDWLSETEYQLTRQALLEIFEILNKSYQQALSARQSLDFDSMEEIAVRLLRIPTIKQQWQAKIDSLMVDEFQDTNERQREIVTALTSDRAGKLFVVGDARQSIYRFRQADVGVFRRMISENKAQGGSVFELGTSYRTHRFLLDCTQVILSEIMGISENPARIFQVEFSPLIPFFQQPRSAVKHPYLEFVLAPSIRGESENGKLSMAYALSERLIRARESGEIESWSEVAILCRTTNSFELYENALDDAGIPYVTASGKGFLRRPEVRDLINVLRALADPADDLAMAGLLRSPMFGLSDTALLQLRGDKNFHFYEALSGELPKLSSIDLERMLIARKRLAVLFDLIDRVPAAELIKKVVDITHYLAILSLANMGNSQRQWRNIEKLINDARSSGKTLLRDYLEWIDNYAELNLEQAEAVVDSMDAVRIMTIHAAKGLEFPLVVLGEASRKKSPGFYSDIVYSKTTGLAFTTRKNTIHYSLSKLIEDEEEASEIDRLLYVALTRASEKLIINGSITRYSDGKLARGSWLYDMAVALGTDFPEEPNQYRLYDGRYSVEINAPQSVSRYLPSNQAKPDYPAIQFGAMMNDLRAVAEGASAIQSGDEVEGQADLADTPAARWRLEGTLTHKALELGLMSQSPEFLPFSRAFLSGLGVTDPLLVDSIIKRVTELVERFERHPLAEKIRCAELKRHELNYISTIDGRVSNGVIDLLVLLEGRWTVLDFKTDHISTAEELEEHFKAHRPQLRRYAQVFTDAMQVKPELLICFLDDQGQVSVRKVE
ncbi:MAG TPA: UvrD-helicase domain-containing protein [Anaerolineales bacterium]|nr:UvrD-helicase domain-containing protein [Anaerolineales bacterium]